MRDNDIRAFPYETDQLPSEAPGPAEELHRLWQLGQRPALGAFLEQCGDLAPVEFVAVLRVDQRARWDVGERIPAESYLDRFPKLRDDSESALDVIYGEFLLREQRGEPAGVDEFVARFPGLEEILRRQIGLHQALRDESLNEPNSIATSSGDRDHRRPGFGGYEIVREIGRGGMGIVYEARQAGINRIVALKVLSAGAHAGPEQLSRFRAEAELVGRLQHPHIVQIHEAGQQEGFPFLALEFVSGGSLRNRMNGQPQAPAWSARLIETLARAVHAAHEAGVVHRDLKPGNILFASGRDGDSGRRVSEASSIAGEIPKIADFGLAKALWESGDNGTSDRLTRTGDILGTPSYMSPEQAAGRAEVGPATDTYALGAILYELLTGRPPFQGVTALETLQHVASEEPAPPSRLQPRLPHDLEVICLKCLEKQPEQRYATAVDLAEDLRRFLTGESILARPTPKLARLGRWCLRNPLLAGLGGLVATLAAIVVVGSVTSTINSRRAADELLVEARLAEARAVRLSDRMGRREQSRSLLTDAAYAHSSPQVRDEAIAGMALFDLPLAGRGPKWSPDSVGIDFDGPLAHYALSDRLGQITVGRVADDVEICRIPELVPNAAFLLSPDGHYLAVRSDASGKLEVWSVDSEVPKIIVSEPCQAMYGMGPVDFKRDSRLVSIGRPDGTVSVNSLPPGRTQREWKFDAAVAHLAFHPSRPQIAIAGRDWVQIRDYESGRLLVRLDDAAGATWVAWHPDGELLATADAGRGITLWEPNEFRRFRTLRGHDSSGIQLRFNASGTMLCSQAWDEVMRFWDPYDGILLFTSRMATALALRCATDRDEWVGTVASGRVRFWQADEHEVYGRLTAGSSTAAERYIHLAISPQGVAGNRLLAAATPQGVRLWDLATRRPIGLLPGRSIGRVHFDATGALWTNSPAGIMRWLVEELTDEPGTLGIGPVHRVLPDGGDGDLASTPDGRLIAFGGTSGAFVWNADRPDSRLKLEGHGDPRYVAVSPDGRWIATGSHTRSQVKIWDAQTGAPVHELAMGGSRVEFSPDGAWLSTTSGGLALWSVGDWNRAWEGAGKPFSGQAFSPDGRIVAVEDGAGAIVLYASRSGNEVARLSDPYGQRQIWLTFSADHRFLAGIAFDFRNLCLWDLNEIDRRLKEMSVAWDWPSSPAAPADAPATIPLKIAMRLENRPETDAVIDDYSTAIAGALSGLAAIGANDPREAHYCNQLAWYYVTAPAELRQPDEALALVRRALRHEPNRAAYLNTLGVALCRRGEWDEAIDALRRSLRAGSDTPAGDLYFLALCFHRLQDSRLATEAFEQAVYWHDVHEDRLNLQTRCELAAIQQEVEGILKLSRDIRQDAGSEQTTTP